MHPCGFRARNRGSVFRESMVKVRLAAAAAAAASATGSLWQQPPDLDRRRCCRRCRRMRYSDKQKQI